MDFGAYSERSTPPFPRAALCIRTCFTFVLTDRHAGSFFRGRRAGRNEERVARFRCYRAGAVYDPARRQPAKKPEILEAS